MDESSQPLRNKPIQPLWPPRTVKPDPASEFSELGTLMRWLARSIYTHNPFYLLSAWLVFSGLRFSFNTHGESFETGALMLGLIGYTLLLAGSAWFLIWIGKVWDDVRTQLLLVLLMLLAMSVTFDDSLAANPRIGVWYFVGGLAFAVAVSEGLLRGLRIRLPALFRLPFYLILGLFFLYPAALGPLVANPRSPVLQWALFGFAASAGLLFLTLLPAIRRGPGYVRENGTPWQWPAFPWVLFAILALGVCGRSYYLCVSLHFVGGEGTIFAPYFLVPLLLVLNILLLEIGLTSRLPKVTQTAMIVPVGLVALSVTGPTAGANDFGFLSMFTGTLGASPLFLTLLASMAFYGLALLRRVPYAASWLMASVLVLSVTNAGSVGPATLVIPRGLPILAVGAVQLYIGFRRRSPCWLALAACFLVAALTFDLRGTFFVAHRGLLPAHLLLAAMMLIAAGFTGLFTKVLQSICAALVLVAGLVAIAGDPRWLDNPPSWLLRVYPLLAVLVAIAYGWFARNRFFLAAAGGIAGCWLVIGGAHAYASLRRSIVGLDKIALGVVFFLVAMVISLSKAGVLRRWLPERGQRTSRESTPVRSPEVIADHEHP